MHAENKVTVLHKEKNPIKLSVINIDNNNAHGAGIVYYGAIYGPCWIVSSEDGNNNKHEQTVVLYMF